MFYKQIVNTSQNLIFKNCMNNELKLFDCHIFTTKSKLKSEFKIFANTEKSFPICLCWQPNQRQQKNRALL